LFRGLIGDFILESVNFVLSVVNPRHSIFKKQSLCVCV